MNQIQLVLWSPSQAPSADMANLLTEQRADLTDRLVIIQLLRHLYEDFADSKAIGEPSPIYAQEPAIDVLSQPYHGLLALLLRCSWCWRLNLRGGTGLELQGYQSEPI